MFGSSGKNGRGSLDFLSEKNLSNNVDCLVGSLELATGSVGGFCAGNQDVIDHQVLYGSGGKLTVVLTNAKPWKLTVVLE
jgi:7-keto-8-aminopelargonate synthetase-like enzyme